MIPRTAIRPGRTRENDVRSTSKSRPFSGLTITSAYDPKRTFRVLELARPAANQGA